MQIGWIRNDISFFSLSYLERMHSTMNLQNLRHDIHRGSESLCQQDKSHTLIAQPPDLPCMAGSRSRHGDSLVIFIVLDRTGF